MKTDSQIMSELASASGVLHVLTEKESDALKDTLLLMLSDFNNICKDYNLEYMLAGGSCLGVIRHQGFIPWDDDLDIMMYRLDYDKLVQLCLSGALGDSYEIDVPQRYTDSKCPYLKIYRKGTLDDEIYNENTPFPKGIFIDVFPMDSAPRSYIKRKIKGFISDLLHVICTCVLYSQYRSKKYLEFVSNNKEALRRYRFRLFIGTLCGIVPHKKWVYFFDRFNSCSDNTGFITIPSGRKRYFAETRKADVYFPIKYGLFEGRRVPICNNPHLYLQSLYNNYMDIPPEEKRERHLVYQFYCPSSK